MKASFGATARLFAILFLACLAGPARGAAQEQVPSYWRSLFVERLSETYRVGNQAPGSQNCIGWACRGVLLGVPIHHSGTALPSPGSIIAGARRHSVDLGVNVGIEHGAMALREMEAIERYKTLHSSAAIWEWLHRRGPVAAAIYWDELMTSHKGRLRAVPVSDGSRIGREAHAITILGWSPSHKAFYFTPNLGRHWGRKGFAFIKEEDLPAVLMEAVGFVHEGTDRFGSPGESSESASPGILSEGENVSSAYARHTLLQEALSRVEAVSRSLRKPEARAADPLR